MLASPGGLPWYLPLQEGHTLFKGSSIGRGGQRGDVKAV